MRSKRWPVPEEAGRMTSLLSLRGENELVKEVAALSGQNLYACYQGGKCTAGCPFSFGPQQVVRYLQLGDVAGALAFDAVRECAGCLTCTAACPKGVDPVRIMKALRALAPERLAAFGGDASATDGAGRRRGSASRAKPHGSR